jgi:hypothetical protein
MPRKLTLEEFVEKAIEIHGGKYDYSKVVYKGNNKTPVEIICLKPKPVPLIKHLATTSAVKAVKSVPLRKEQKRSRRKHEKSL